MTKTEIELVTLAKEHDESAMAELYEMTYARIYASVRGVLRNDADAEDVLQDTYISAFTHLDTLRDADKFQPWIYRIAMNNCKNYLKRKKPALFTDLKGEDDADVDFTDDRDTFSPEKQMDLTDTVEIFDSMFEKLPEDQKLCIVMFYRDEMSVSEIADYLDISEGTVKSRLYYGRKKIRVEVDDMAKKGVKLYGVTPFLSWLLVRQMSDTEATAAIPPAGGVMAAVQNASAGVGAGISSAGTNATFSGPTQAASAQAAGIITSKAAGLFAKVGLNKLVTGIGTGKLVAGIAAVVIVGAVVGNVLLKGDTPEVSQDTPASVARAEESSANTNPNEAGRYEAFYQLLKEKIDDLGTLPVGNLYDANSSLNGVGDAMLIDFDGDGLDELFIYFRQEKLEEDTDGWYFYASETGKTKLGTFESFEHSREDGYEIFSIISFEDSAINYFDSYVFPVFIDENPYKGSKAYWNLVRLYDIDEKNYYLQGPCLAVDLGSESLWNFVIGKFEEYSYHFDMDAETYQAVSIDTPEYFEGVQPFMKIDANKPYTAERAAQLQTTLDKLKSLAKNN